MATVSHQDADRPGMDRGELVEVLVGPFRTRSVKYFLGFEVFLVVGGFLIDYLWGSPTGWADHPDFHLALGVVMAGLAIVFTAIFLVIYLLVVGLTIRDRRRTSVEF